MAKQLSKQDIVTRKVVKPWHVSQSVDAFTGTEAYDITISGSLTVTGSVLLNGLSTSSQANVLTFDETTGQLFYTASSAIGGGGSSIDTGSFVTTSSFNSFTGSYNTGSFTGSFTGSLQGTASWAQNSLTASYVDLVAAGNNFEIQYNSGSSFKATGSFKFNYLSESLEQGYATTASGLYSHAEGAGTVAMGLISHAEGFETLAEGLSDHAEGYQTTASSVGFDFGAGVSSSAHAEGNQTQAYGVASHAEGSNTKTSGSICHTEGYGTLAFGIASHAEGIFTTASSIISNDLNLGGAHAEGFVTFASGGYSHAEGFKTISKGVGSHAEGSGSLAVGMFSHAEGNNTIAISDYQHTQGTYNLAVSGTGAFIIGNGLDNSNRSNLIFAADNTVQITGSLIVSGSITGSNGVINPLTSSYAITASHALNVSVQTSGSSLYSTNPATSGFSTNNSIFLGANAGYLASNAIYSYFLGQTAGANATNARFSNFFGQSAGQGATNSSGSNFFGAAAGQLASNAAYSNLFGYYVGRNNIGPNNIIIGTNISLPDGRQDSINIGGIIFGTGSYSNISGNSYTGSQSLGRIGIAKDNPNSTLDISGSVLVTGSLTISGSSTFTNIGLALFTGSITMSGSITGSNGVINPLTASYAMAASYSQTASDILVYVKNQTGFNITKGTVVRIANVNNSSDIPRVTTASYENDANSANTLGIATQLITNGSEGYVITEGILTGIDTTNYTGGQLLYLGATGSITGSAPIAPLHTVRLGEVVRDQTNNGSIYVRIDNGTELGELHDVRDTTTTGSYGDLLVKSGSVWVNSRQLTGSYDLVGSLNVTGSINLNNILTLQPADPLPTVVNGSIAFSSSGDFYFASGSAWRKLTL